MRLTRSEFQSEAYDNPYHIVAEPQRGFWKLSSDSVDVAEVKKAEGTSFTALLIHKPPAFTGRLACDHCMSSKSMLLLLLLLLLLIFFFLLILLFFFFSARHHEACRLKIIN